MRILVDARFDGRGGVSRVGLELLPELARAMPEDQFIFATTGTRTPVGVIHELPLLNVIYRHQSIPNKIWSTLCTLRLASLDQLFKKERPDLLFLSNIGFVGKPKIPYTLLVHDISFLIEPHWFPLKQRLWHRAVRAMQLIKNAKHLFAVSDYTKQDLIRTLSIPAERITVIPFGTTLQTIEADPSPPSFLAGKRFLLALGGKDPRKNTSCAIAAVHELRKKIDYHDVQLVIVGMDRRESTELFIHPLGRPNDRALASLMKHASALLYPSWYEGFGLPLHEAAHFGTPCIASTASALPETAPQGTLFAPPGKPHLWTSALTSILNAPSLHQTHSSLHNWKEAAKAIKIALLSLE